jgi:hypothetical protein
MHSKAIPKNINKNLETNLTQRQVSFRDQSDLSGKMQTPSRGESRRATTINQDRFGLSVLGNNNLLQVAAMMRDDNINYSASRRKTSMRLSMRRRADTKSNSSLRKSGMQSHFTRSDRSKSYAIRNRVKGLNEDTMNAILASKEKELNDTSPSLKTPIHGAEKIKRKVKYIIL